MNQDAKKTMLRRIPYGLYALGVHDGERGHAMTVNWVSQCAFEPPMLTISVELESRSLPLLRAAGAFALSVFPTGARSLAGKLGRASANVPDKFDDVPHHSGPVTGSPILDDATGWIECRIVSEHPAGDHVVMIAEVVEAGVNNDTPTLTMAETGFRYSG